MSPLYLALPVRCLVLAHCLVRLWIHVQLIQGGLWKNVYEFLLKGLTLDPEVDSRPALFLLVPMPI